MEVSQLEDHRRGGCRPAAGGETDPCRALQRGVLARPPRGGGPDILGRRHVGHGPLLVAGVDAGRRPPGKLESGRGSLAGGAFTSGERRPSGSALPGKRDALPRALRTRVESRPDRGGCPERPVAAEGGVGLTVGASSKDPSPLIWRGAGKSSASGSKSPKTTRRHQWTVGEIGVSVSSRRSARAACPSASTTRTRHSG